jgi:putative toxin-antitoxin system antitoxin component (TIGR02293 family)
LKEIRALDFLDNCPILIDKCPKENSMTQTEIKTREQLDREINKFLEKAISAFPIKKRKKRITFSDFLSDKRLIILAIREGIPYSIFNSIQDLSPLSTNVWAKNLYLSPKSLSRYRHLRKSFKPMQSERIIELAEVLYLGSRVFGDEEKFKLWLDTPSYPLGSIKPIDLLEDSYGKEMVIGELIRIEHGIFA